MANFSVKLKFQEVSVLDKFHREKGINGEKKVIFNSLVVGYKIFLPLCCLFKSKN